MSWKWIALMAWRDGRRRWSRMWLFTSSIIMGITALVSISGFQENLSADIDRQAADLLGADFVLESRTAPSPQAMRLIDSVAGISVANAREERFVSMLQAPAAGTSRFVQIRAVEGGYPFYGQIDDAPSGSFSGRTADDSGIWMEQTLFQQLGVALFDTLRLGQHTLPVIGSILSLPGQRSLQAALAPQVFLAHADLKGSGLKQPGSRVEYLYYFLLPEHISGDQLREELDQELDRLQLSAETIETVKEDTGRSFRDMTKFMELSGFVALLLGCLGVWSAAQVFVREKERSVAILRCMGASAASSFYIYLTQFVVMGGLGGAIGALLGTAMQFFMPALLQGMLPVQLTPCVSWTAIAQGLVMGPVVAALFAILPLARVRQVPPLHTLRMESPRRNISIDGFRLSVYALILGFLYLYTRLQMDDWRDSLWFVAALLVIFASLYGFAKLITWGLRRYLPSGLPYLLRQGVVNLYRPNNQTRTLVLVIGLGTALIGSVLLIQDLLIQRVHQAADESGANMLMFDIQPSQREGLEHLAREKQYAISETVPVVTMRLERVRGLDLNDVLGDSTLEVSQRAFRGEIRATYRDSLTAAERVMEGSWVGRVGPGERASVSLSESYADRLAVEVGDELEFNVQGLPVAATVSSIRKVDWNRFQSNFRVVFAEGTIDQAPQFYLMMANLPNPEDAARFQTDVVEAFPNVSVVDLHAMLETLSRLFTQVGFVVTFLASFSVLTGVLVLIGALRISKRQRVAENVTLRTLGADSRQIYWINLNEYLSLGLLAAFAGALLALVVGCFLAVFVFDMDYSPAMGTLSVMWFGSALLTALIGMLNSVSVIRSSPLESLRRNG